jgi:chromosome segregation ATPase
MAFDLKSALDKVTDPAKRKALEDALKEQTEFISVLEATATELETEKSKRTEWEADKKKIEENWRVANDEYSTIVNDLDATQKQRDEAQKKIKDAEAAKLAAEQRLAEAIKNKPAEVDTSKFLTQEQLDEKMRQHAGAQTAYFGETLDTVAEVERITGKRISPNQLIKDSIAAKKTPREYAEETYKLAELRTDAEKKATEKRDRENEDKGYQKALAEMRNPALRTLEDSSDPFYVPKTDKGPVQPWEQPEGYVPEDEQKFLQELTTGKIQ